MSRCPDQQSALARATVQMALRVSRIHRHSRPSPHARDHTRHSDMVFSAEQTRGGFGRNGQDSTVVANRLEGDQFLSSRFLIPCDLRELRVLLLLALLVRGLGVAGADLSAMT